MPLRSAGIDKEENMLKLLTTVATAAAFAALSWNVANAQAIEKKDITLGLPLNTSTLLPIYVADAQGFFKEEGRQREGRRLQGRHGTGARAWSPVRSISASAPSRKRCSASKAARA